MTVSIGKIKERRGYLIVSMTGFVVIDLFLLAGRE
jgi:hypothetical protein